MANETSNGVIDQLLSAAVGAGVAAAGWLLTEHRRSQELRQADARVAQQLADHLKECDERYKAMAEKQTERHAQNQREMQMMVESSRRVEDKLDSFIRTFVRIGGA